MILQNRQSELLTPETLGAYLYDVSASVSSRRASG